MEPLSLPKLVPAQLGLHAPQIKLVPSATKVLLQLEVANLGNVERAETLLPLAPDLDIIVRRRGSRSLVAAFKLDALPARGEGVEVF